MTLENICAQLRPRNNEGLDVRVQHGDEIGPVVRLEPAQAEVLVRTLTWACYDEPQFRYIIPDEQTRLRLLPGFFRGAIRSVQPHGEIYTTKGVHGGVLWIAPGSVLPLVRIAQMESPMVSLQWRWTDLKRCITTGVHLDNVHRQLVRGPHWRLLMLGVKPSEQDSSLSRALIQPILSRADFDGLPCYVEIFNDRNLPFYEEHGFRIAGGGKISRDGPDFWAMIRRPTS